MFDILLVAIYTSRILALLSLQIHTASIIGVLQLSMLVLGYEFHLFTLDVKKKPLPSSPFKQLSNSYLMMDRRPEDRPKDVAVNEILQKLSPEVVLFGTCN